MGRSKTTVAPGSAKSPMSQLSNSNTSKSPKPTSNKASAKRPLPTTVDSEDEEESVAQLLGSGFPKHKKGRFNQPQVENTFGSDNDEDEDDDDEDEVDDDDEDDDSDASDAENDEDEDDDEDAEDDETENDDSADEDAKSDSRKNNVSSEAGVTPVSPSVKASAALSTSANQAISSPSKAAAQISVRQPKLNAQAEKRSNDEHLFLIPHPPRDVQDVKKVMEGAGYSVADIRMLNIPMAVATVGSLNNLKLEETTPPALSFKGTSVHLIHLNGSKEALSKLEVPSTTTILVTGIPKSVTLELLLSTLPRDCQPINSKLLDKGPKNKFFNAAILSFPDKQSSGSAHSVLSQTKFENHAIRSTFIKDRDDVPQSDGLRGCTKCLLASQLPPTVTEMQLKSIFTTALDFNLLTRGGETQCLITFADENAAVDAFEAHCNSHLGKSKLILRFAAAHETGGRFQAYVDNVPQDATVSQVIAAFSGAINASQLASGTYIVSFPSLEARRKAILERKTINNSVPSVSVDGGLDGNILFVKNVPFVATEENLRSVYPEATNISILFKPNGRSAGVATVEFQSAKQCLDMVGKKLSLMGRPLFQSLKRVTIGSEASAPFQSQKRKLERPALSATSTKAPPQVGSGSENSASEDQEESMDEDLQTVEPASKKSKPITQTTKATKKPASESESEDEDLGSEEEDEGDEDDEDEDDVDVDEDDDDEEDEDEGVEDDSDEEVSQQKSQKHQLSQKHGMKVQDEKSGDRAQNNSFNAKSKRGFKHDGNYNHDSQRGGGFNRGFNRGGGRDSQRGGGAFNRGSPRGGNGFKRGGGGRGFSRGGNGRNNQQNRGGFRGRNFKKN